MQDDLGLERKHEAAQSGAIRLIATALATHGENDETVSTCALALSIICTGSDDDGLERKQMAAEEGSIEAIIEPLRMSGEVRTLERLCGLLRNLCMGHDVDGQRRKRTAREAGAVAIIERLLVEHPDAKALQDAGKGALRNMRVYRGPGSGLGNSVGVPLRSGSDAMYV